MLDAIKAFLSGKAFADQADEPPEHRTHLATAALLLEVGIADFELGEQELSEIANALRNHFHFSASESEELLRLARAAHDQHVSIHPFLKLVNESFTPAQKRQMVESMWRVAYADKRLDKYEEYQIRKIADLLYVSHKDFIRAKLRVQDELNGSTEA